jgi:hypothetical protein
MPLQRRNRNRQQYQCVVKEMKASRCMGLHLTPLVGVHCRRSLIGIVAQRKLRLTPRSRPARTNVDASRFVAPEYTCKTKCPRS